MQINIDYQAGAHGNFLEFVCNIVAGIEANNSPFNQAGAAHCRHYKTKKKFNAKHFSFYKMPFSSNRVIAIKIGVDDLLPLSQISLLRAGDLNIDNDELEFNTYNKLNNQYYRSTLDNLTNSFFKGQIEESYNQVKQPDWPEVKNLDEFEALPDSIKHACLEIHHLELRELSEKRPHCPRHVLREFFQIGFENPEQHGFMVLQQSMMHYPPEFDVYNFSFSHFYDTQQFQSEIQSIAMWAGLSYNNHDRIVKLHEEFLQKQPYKDSKKKCDALVDAIIHNDIELPKITLIEESYVNAMLAKNNYHERRY